MFEKYKLFTSSVSGCSGWEVWGKGSLIGRLEPNHEDASVQGN